MLRYALVPMVSLPEGAIDTASSFLNQKEMLRLETLAAPSRREQFVAGRWLVRQLLCEMFGGKPASWHLHIASSGAPEIFPFLGVYPSISHSGQWIAAAISDAPVGIDIEQVYPKRDVDAIAGIVCSPSEIEGLKQIGQEQKLREFTTKWTLKEAWLKRDGRGLDFALMRSLVAQGTGIDEANACSWRTEEDLAVAIVNKHIFSLAASALSTLPQLPAYWALDSLKQVLDGPETPSKPAC